MKRDEIILSITTTELIKCDNNNNNKKNLIRYLDGLVYLAPELWKSHQIIFSSIFSPLL